MDFFRAVAEAGGYPKRLFLVVGHQNRTAIKSQASPHDVHNGMQVGLQVKDPGCFLVEFLDQQGVVVHQVGVGLRLFDTGQVFVQGLGELFFFQIA